MKIFRFIFLKKHKKVLTNAFLWYIIYLQTNESEELPMMNTNEIKKTAATATAPIDADVSLFDFYTDEDFDAMYEAYCAENGIVDIPDTLEWGLR